ncbi:MAG: adenylyl-sulfate kinase, partial [Planctomycetota bacterium]
LDGDNIRHGLNKNLGFSPQDRKENIRRIGEVAKLFADAGITTLASFISPYIKDRELAREIHKKANLGFIEVFVDTPIEECEKRDPKGMYKKAREALAAGKGMGFTGVDAPYELPPNPEIVIHNDKATPQEAAAMVINYLEENGFLPDLRE